MAAPSLSPPSRLTEMRQGLNASQQRAVDAATTQALTLVQGPPGTGKTKVALTVIMAWLEMGLASQGCPLLATSDSNTAVDNLLAGLAECGVRVVRLGRHEMVREDLHRFMAPREQNGKRKEKEVELSRMVSEADVVCCTSMHVGSAEVRRNLRLRFESVLIDEATQATEASTVVALARGAKRLVMLGDQCQLPPTTLARHEKIDTALPLFTRLMQEGVAPLLLDTQYRMAPAISMLPSDLFYAGKLKDGICAADRPPPAGFRWPRNDMPVAMLNTSGSERSVGTSFINLVEAQAACEVVRDLLQGGMQPADIGVITGYAAQARHLSSLGMLRGIEVGSIDGFQGRELEVVIVSCVRTNGIGFLADARRANVALTRARSGLIVLGAQAMLSSGDHAWARWLRWARAHGLCFLQPAWGRYDAHATRAASSTIFARMDAASVSRGPTPTPTPTAPVERAGLSNPHVVPQAVHSVPRATPPAQGGATTDELDDAAWAAPQPLALPPSKEPPCRVQQQHQCPKTLAQAASGTNENVSNSRPPAPPGPRPPPRPPPPRPPPGISDAGINPITHLMMPPSYGYDPMSYRPYQQQGWAPPPTMPPMMPPPFGYVWPYHGPYGWPYHGPYR